MTTAEDPSADDVVEVMEQGQLDEQVPCSAERAACAVERYSNATNRSRMMSRCRRRLATEIVHLSKAVDQERQNHVRWAAER